MDSSVQRDIRISRFKLAGPPTPRDTEASNAYAVIHDSLGPVCICSLIGINSIKSNFWRDQGLGWKRLWQARYAYGDHMELRRQAVGHCALSLPNWHMQTTTMHNLVLGLFIDHYACELLICHG